jgi:hypothetical protein
MHAQTNVVKPSAKLVWLGRVISGLLILLFGASAIVKLVAPPDPRIATIGLPENVLVPLGIVELTCAIVYLVPATSVLGAILLTGYIGGMIVTHLRVGDPFYVQIALGVLVWLGLCLREPRLWRLMPLRRFDDSSEAPRVDSKS